jgi:curved DNA-binding protein CbpA
VATNYYNVLGVPRNATEQQIREQFKRLARQRHPDRFRGAEKAEAEAGFQAITEAFNVLTNSERRRRHDLDLARPDGQVGQTVDNQQLTRVYLQRGVRAYRDKNYLEAADNFDRATKTDPENAQAWYNLALACSHQSRWLSRAMSAIAKACELEPMKAHYLRAAGRIFARGGLSSRAEQYYSESLKWGGDDQETRDEITRLKVDPKRPKGGLFG